MSDFIFLFDLDSTITGQEILPTISQKVGKETEMRELTEKTMLGEVPFKESFLKRVEILKNIPINEVQDIVADIRLNEHITNFILENKNRCYIVTGNLDIWIYKLMKKLDLEKNIFCSKALCENNQLKSVISVIDKSLVCEQFVQEFVAVGDGNNDADMIRMAKYGIGFGGVRSIAPALLKNADFAFNSDKKLYDFLNRLK